MKNLTKTISRIDPEMHYTVKEIAKIFKVCNDVVYRRLKESETPKFRVSNTYYIQGRDVLKMMGFSGDE